MADIRMGWAGLELYYLLNYAVGRETYMTTQRTRAPTHVQEKKRKDKKILASPNNMTLRQTNLGMERAVIRSQVHGMPNYNKI